MKKSILYPAALWTAAIALCDLIFYPMIIPAPSPICGVPAHPAAYSGDHFGRVLIFFFVFFAVGGVAFGLARAIKKAWIGPVLLFGVCTVLAYLSIDHDYPSCNSLSPTTSILLSLATRFLPTVIIGLGWQILGSRRRD